jgi:hypothetical protein
VGILKPINIIPFSQKSIKECIISEKYGKTSLTVMSSFHLPCA